MNLGLVLSGGGMRGVAHVGAIRAMQEKGIKPTHIAGSSAGAVVGALYAYGYDWKEMLDFFKKLHVLDIKKYAIKKPGFIDAEKFYSEFKQMLKNDNFESLNKKLFVTATNILDGKLEIFTEGELILPVIASAAIPGIFSPVKINDSYYVDGGTLNNFPIEPLKDICSKIIGVYVNGFQVVTYKELKYSHNVAERALKLKSVKEDQAKFNEFDILISPNELSKYGTFDKKFIDDIFNIGYAFAKQELELSEDNFANLTQTT